MSKKPVFVALAALAVLLLCSGGLRPLEAQEKKLIKKGDAFPGLPLKTPTLPQDRTYLGISGGDSFMLKDLKAEVFLVEIFDVYCIPCQRQAPLYRELFDMIRSDPAVKDKIKMIGVDVGNEESEIKKFRDHFKIPYAIVSDPEYVLHKAVGGPPAPFAIIVRKDPGGKSVVVADTHLGFNKDMPGLFKQLRSLVR